jgi:hypothetical protein
MAAVGRGAGRRLTEPYNYYICPSLAIRVYPDKRPGNMETAGIHKALILVADGFELVEEGAGFGLPVAKFNDKTFFPGSAVLSFIDEGPPPVVEKTYIMDTVSVKQIGGSRISDTLYHPIHRAFSRLYLSLGRLRFAFDTVMELRNVVGVRTSFETAKPRGSVVVRYTLHPDIVEIEGYAELEASCKELVFLNEQGASIFRRYSDANAVELIDERMGAWDRIEAGEATLSDLENKLSFTVHNPRRAGFFRGRELVRGRLSWAGLSLSFKPQERIGYSIGVSIR